MINLNTVDLQAARALLRLREPGNEALLGLLQGLVEEAKTKLVYVDEMGLIHRLQGRAEAYEDLLKAVEEAAKVVNRA
jgi:hypothetical protein